MQNAKVLSIIGLGMTLVALVVGHAIPRFELAQPKQLPVETFPRQIGEWKGGADNPVDAAVQKKLATARILDREYTNSTGHSINLTLVSANRYEDIHDPKICFPFQGWTLEEQETVSVDGQKASFMVAKQGGNELEVLYWYTGKTIREEGIPNKLNALRGAFINVEGNSVMVRLLVKHTPEDHTALLEFAHQIQAPLATLQKLAQQP